MNRIRNAKKGTIDGVLFLQGVFMKDCRKIEDIFTDRLLGDGKNEVKQYDKIPSTFTGLNTHPKNTNLLCWNCHRAVKGRPWFEPQSIDAINKGSVGEIVLADQLNRSGGSRGYIMACVGNFCGPFCVKKWIDVYTKDMSERLNKIDMLRFEYEIFMGKSISDIPSAPRHTEMVQYGGTCSAVEYQKKMDELDIINGVEDNSFATTCREYAIRLLVD